jgi:hypothetical protein
MLLLLLRARSASLQVKPHSPLYRSLSGASRGLSLSALAEPPFSSLTLCICRRGHGDQQEETGSRCTVVSLERLAASASRRWRSLRSRGHGDQLLGVRVRPSPASRSSSSSGVNQPDSRVKATNKQTDRQRNAKCTHCAEDERTQPPDNDHPYVCIVLYCIVQYKRGCESPRGALNCVKLELICTTYVPFGELVVLQMFLLVM